MSYTRDGEFFLDGNGFLTNASGMNLQGYNAIGGTVVPQLTDLQIDSAGVPGSATANITLDAMLSADTEPGSDLAAMDFYGTGSGTNTFEDAVNASDYSTSTTVYDSLGVGHDVTILFERQDDNTWQYRAITDATSVYDSSGNAFSTDDGAAFEIASGTVDFGTDGAISAFTPDAASATTWTFLGADPTDLNFDFGMDSSGNLTSGALQMSGSESTVSSITQDGYGPGSLTGIEIQPDGSILGSYTNGQQTTLGQVTLATFASEAGLERQGGSMYSAGLNSGLPTFGQPGSGSFGSISGNSLEQSNVDLETELVGMITYQRTYQANAKVVSAANETLQSLVNML